MWSGANGTRLMEDKATGNERRAFENPQKAFSGLAAAAAAALVAAGADITLVIGENGLIRDVAYNDLSLAAYGLNSWAGKAWRDTVTAESAEKITAMLEDVTKTGESRARQVNHPAKGRQDLPVDYRMASVPANGLYIAYGRDLRGLAEMQQQLVHTQMELEREYRRIRDTEARYRSAFQRLQAGVLIVSGSDMKILDANAAAGDLFGLSVARLTGQPVRLVARRDERDTLTAAFGEAIEAGAAQQLQITAADGDGKLDVSIEPFRERGAVNCIVHVHASGGDDLRSAGDSPAGMHDFNALPEAVALTDARGVVREVNNEFLDLLHSLNRTAVVGRNVSAWLGASSVECQMLFSRIGEEGHVRGFPSTLRDELGRDVPVRVSANAREDGDEVVLVISEQIQATNQLTVTGSGMASASSDFSDLVGRVPLKELIREASDVIEKLCIEAALRQTGNNRASAAEMLGLSRQSLYIKLRRYGLESFDGQD